MGLEGYGNLTLMNMVRKGLMGEVLHAEGGYVHDLSGVASGLEEAGVGPHALWPAGATRSGGEGVGGHWGKPTRTQAERTRYTPGKCRQRKKLQLPCSYGNITVRTMSRVSVSPKRNPLCRAECFSGTPRATLPGTKTGARTDRVFLQRYGSEADDEVRQSPLCLCRRPHEASRALLRAHLQGQWQDGQCEAFTGSSSPV